MKKLMVTLMLLIAIMGCEKKAEVTSTAVYVEVDDDPALTTFERWIGGRTVDEMTDIESRHIRVWSPESESALRADFDGATKKITWSVTNADPIDFTWILMRADAGEAFKVWASTLVSGIGLEEDVSKRLMGAKKVKIRARRIGYGEILMTFDVKGFDDALAWLKTGK
jgi:hypothetical protein